MCCIVGRLRSMVFQACAPLPQQLFRNSLSQGSGGPLEQRYASRRSHFRAWL